MKTWMTVGALLGGMVCVVIGAAILFPKWALFAVGIILWVTGACWASIAK